MHLKLLLAHILIWIITTLGFTYLYFDIENETLQRISVVFHLTIVVVLYVVSGFLATGKTKIFNVKNYYSIALIGFILWLIAVLNSPTDMNWKNGFGGILWLLHNTYISGIELPIFFSFGISIKNIKLQIVLLLIITIIPSLLQAYGGFLKIKRNKKP
jgi:hypothetical protein